MTAAPSFDITALLPPIAAGDEGAFRLLYDQYWHRIYSTGLAFTQSHHQAMEIVQETFLRIWKNRSRLAEIENLEAFIYTIAKNRIKTILKQHRTLLVQDRFATVETEAPQLSPERESALRQFEQLVHEATKILPEQQAVVFRLSRFEQLSYEEIAERLHLSPATVRNHMIKALGFMRRHFYDRHQDLLILLVWSGVQVFSTFFSES